MFAASWLLQCTLCDSQSNIKKQLKAHNNWDVLIEPIEGPNSIKMFNRFKDRVKTIETAWKTEIKLQFKTKDIDRETRDAKLQYIIDNPLITINRIWFWCEILLSSWGSKILRDVVLQEIVFWHLFLYNSYSYYYWCRSRYYTGTLMVFVRLCTSEYSRISPLKLAYSSKRQT